MAGRAPGHRPSRGELYLAACGVGAPQAQTHQHYNFILPKR